LSKLHILQFKLPKNIGVAKKQRKRGKNSQYWLINIIAEVKIECSSIIYLSSNLIKQSRTWNTQSPWYICNSCAYKILLTPKALGIKFLGQILLGWAYPSYITSSIWVYMHIILLQLAPSRGGANNLSNHWQERKNTLCGVPIEGYQLRDVHFKVHFCLCNEESLWLAPIKEIFWKLWHFPPKYKLALPKYKLYCHFYFKTLWSVSLWPAY
jgi:hypothetical protein